MEITMSQVAAENVRGRLLTDDLFRLRAGQSLRTACLEEGFSLSEEELPLVGELDMQQLDGISGMLDGGITRFMTRQTLSKEAN